MIGAGIQYRPDYIGSNDYELARYIKVSARFGDAIVSTSGRLGFLSYRFGRFAVGPIIRLERGRTENNNVALIGLGDIGRTVEGGLYIGYWGKWINVIGSFRHGIATGHNASMASVQFTSYLIRTPNFGLSASIKGTWASAKYMKRFFAINAEQAAASGYPIHNIGAGVRDIRLILLAQYWFNDAWALNAFVHYSRLTVAVAGSPIVALEGAANQVAVGLYLSYTI